jgi:hypothetical protein
LAGFSAAALSGTTANSAIEPVPRSKMLAKTASPTLKRVTRLPTSVTTPARSLPIVAGSWNFTTALKSPVGIMLSIGFTLCRVHLDQHFVGLQRGARHVGEPDLGRLAIAFEGECFHGGSMGFWGVRLAGLGEFE